MRNWAEEGRENGGWKYGHGKERGNQGIYRWIKEGREDGWMGRWACEGREDGGWKYGHIVERKMDGWTVP